MNHSLRMLAGCVLPLLLIFLLPLFGVGEGITLFIFMILMFACHLFMMKGHEHHGIDHSKSGGLPDDND